MPFGHHACPRVNIIAGLTIGPETYTAKGNEMQYTKLGRSNVAVSKICLGTMHFGSKTPESEACQIMDKAFDMGINFFDTANRYGGNAGLGASEEIIGHWFQASPARRDQIVLATKVFGNMTEPPIPT